MPFRIAHLSDLHLTARDTDERSEPKLFGRLTGMNANFRSVVTSSHLQKADLVLVTGDVTDRGDLETWRGFWSAMTEAGLREKCLVIPGNHDVCSLGVRLPENPEKDRARMRKGLELGAQPSESTWARVFMDGRLAIVGLDSCNAGNATGATNAIGRLSYPQLERFARQLAKVKDVPLKIVMLHHSPNIPGQEVERKRNLPPTGAVQRWGHELPLEERRALRLLCVSHGVRLILHGHLHRTEDRRVSGMRIIGAPASTQPGQGGALSFFRYEVGGERGQVNVQLEHHRVAAPLRGTGTR